MTAFDTAWDLIKAWGEGFRVHGFNPKAPAVTELVPITGGRGKRNRWDDGWTMENLNPFVGGYQSTHDFTPHRGSGTGVSGTYYHGGPWDPLWSNNLRSNLIEMLQSIESGRNKNNRMVYVPPPKNPIATTRRFRDLSTQLLDNVLTEIGRSGYGEIVQEQGTLNGVPQPPRKWFEQPNTAKTSYRSGNYNTAPALYAFPKTWEDEVDLMASAYSRDRGIYWRNIEDLLRHDSSRSAGGSGLWNNKLFDYLGKTPLVRNIMGSDYGDIDDKEYNWMNDPEVLQHLGERMQDTRGLSPMNILLGEYGHDAVVPIISEDRGSNSMMRETTQGSVALPPTHDNWWEDYHPIEGGEFEPLASHHVQSWIDEFDRNKEITDMTERGKRIQR